MKDFYPLTDCPKNEIFGEDDTLVIFGEVFDKGYVNGLIEEAKRNNMNVIYGTVGRRDENNELRPLTDEEIKEKNQENLINIPLEAGFDFETDNNNEHSPFSQLHGVKRDEWKSLKLNWDSIAESKRKGQERFLKQTRAFLTEVKKHLKPNSNVVFAHTMAGGIPRAKILMPILNRVFKGHGKRFQSSLEFWESEIGRLCAESFDEITARTFQVLIDETKDIRDSHPHVSYTAYGYHGCSALAKDEYTWQSYAPYLQGWAKIDLEDIAKKSWEQGIKAQVFNSPEILTNSSSVFLGIEVCLYPLLDALKKENGGNETDMHEKCKSLLKEPEHLETILKRARNYIVSDNESTQRAWEKWPEHNTDEQMKEMRETSDFLIDLHKNNKELMVFPLSEVVFKATGKAMLCEASNPKKPVWWLGHDVVAKTYLNM